MAREGSLSKSTNDAWRIWIPTPVYFLIWAGFTVLQTLYFPTWLVEENSSVQLIFQTLPATLIALFVLAFTTLFVAAQQVATVFSNRAPLILLEDKRVQRIITRTGVIIIASLVLLGRVPDQGTAHAFVTSAATTLILVTILLVLSYGRFATLLIAEYTAPRSFISRVTAPVSEHLTATPPQVGWVVARVPLLGQVVRYALRRDDSEGAGAAMEGLEDLQAAYIAAAESKPEVRIWRYDKGPPVTGWLGAELRRVFVGTTEEALRLQTPQDELDQLVVRYGNVTRQAIIAGHEEEAETLIIGLAQLATTPYQVTQGATNYLSQTASALAAMERVSEENGLESLAVLALACWAVSILYVRVHFSQEHPLLKDSLSQLGQTPPWQWAIDKSKQEQWRYQWANQLGEGGLNQLPKFLSYWRGQSG